MGITGAHSATLYNSADETEYIQLSKITQDSEFLTEGLSEEDLDGNVVYVEDRARLLLGFMDDADMAQLRTWMRNRTTVKAVVFGVQDYIFWDQASTIRVIDPASFAVRRRNRAQVEMRSRGESLPIEKTKGYILTAESQQIDNFVGLDTTDGDGVTAKAITPASVGADGSISWMGQTMETVILQTS